ncbi:YeiH family protein [Gemelliphila asaccharolytica]|jgi:hypothetical protein|uniref:Sulfate exporter family transporter n=1 Tax=Gemelliphila asaccharolytica TaxID=502393 RepID=A0ABR5TMW6_9BACL|nr:YeiH family protein [Gemella asaccharolytica]KXB58704.1 hypothetical protein HMPREF1871_00253 [Gemella asaccharolytica]
MSMSSLKTNYKGILLCLIIALPCTYLGHLFPLIGGAVIAIIAGMILTHFIPHKDHLSPGITFTAKKILQYAVILLGFGMNLSVVIKTGKESLPIIISTICTSLIVAYIVAKLAKMDSKTSTLIGVGSSICGGSAVAATAPVIEASGEEVAQAISVIFFFNVLAAIIFPTLGTFLGFSHLNGDAFGIFAGTAVNDTSSVTAAAATWDNMYNLGTQTLDKAVTVKLTRTLAIIPITLILAFYTAKKNHHRERTVSMKSVFPFFILLFVIASIITTVCVHFGVDIKYFKPFKELSKFFIVMAMTAIGLNTDIVKLVKTGGKPIALGFCCWIAITIVTILMQNMLGLF